MREAEVLTKLSGVEKPDARYDYLRCQLGERSSQKVQTSAFRTINAPVFRLIAFGTTWERAVEMYEQAKKAAVL